MILNVMLRCCWLLLKSVVFGIMSLLVMSGFEYEIGIQLGSLSLDDPSILLRKWSFIETY